ncbi:MAG: anion transporter [Alphaproteobacteria bacterium]|nr:anion transporter [Alphaproteobacteria bacterium]MBV9554815.1 anion transporter [Alphaproteobacteria bacterium]
MHVALVLLVLILTYAGMAAGRIAWLQVDRTGIALLAVIALLVTGAITLDDFGSNVDMPTLALLFAMMIISAQFAESGFIDLCARSFTSTRHGTTVLLALTVAVGGCLAAVLANDILIVTIAPLLIAGARARGLDPRPFAIALAASTNAGSAATLIGNPQNILVGEIGRLNFWRFIGICGIPASFALITVFVVVWLQWRRRMLAAEPADPAELPPVVSHPFDRNQTIKGAVALAALFLLFLTPLPREVGALFIAAVLLANRKITSRTMIAAVDWPLLLLMACLFAITGTLNQAGVAAQVKDFLAAHTLLPNGLVPLTLFSVVASNTIGSLPSTMLLLQIWQTPTPFVLYSLTILSTLSGNLLLSGSLTNVLIAERAERMGAPLTFREHAQSGVPIAVVSLAFAIAWLWLTHKLPLLPTPLPADQ